MRHPALARDPNPGFQPGPGGLERQVTGLLADDPADGRNDVTLVLATGQHITQPQKFAARTPLARLFLGWIKSCGIVFAGLMGCLHAVPPWAYSFFICLRADSPLLYIFRQDTKCSGISERNRCRQK